MQANQGQGILVATNEVVSLVQPTNVEGTSKKSKPSPFYLSLIIRDKIVHNCMINSGASTSIMPRCVADQVGLKYEPMIKQVIQLGGLSMIMIGIIKGLRMELHASLDCTITQDISIVELPPHFSIFLSRDFTAQIEGYIASD